MDHAPPPVLPSLAELGKDLLVVSPWDIAVSLLRPLLCFALFWPLAIGHHYVWAGLSIAGLLFFTYTSTSHDLVHRTLRLPALPNALVLSALEGICLRSGHAFRLTHLQHHKHFPDKEDIEGADAAKGFWSALACGPLHQGRCFAWAWQHGNGSDRRWMTVEALFVCCVLSLTAFSWSNHPELALYVGLVIGGSWLYPLATVWWPHCAEGKTPLQQTRGFRGVIIPALSFQHTYHLEHHLYPGVSSHHWAELGRRLKPHLLRAGVKFVYLP